MFKLVFILSLFFSCLSISAQVIPNSEISKPSMSKDFWKYELKTTATTIDTSKISLFRIENYLHILNPDSVQVIQDSLSGLSWVVYPRSERPSNGSGQLVVLPLTVPSRSTNKAGE